jgi:hypothetical protein
MFSIARSRFMLPVQFAFLILNALALLLGVVYNHKTPELYENNAHSKTGWIITWIASAWVLMALVRVYAGRTKAYSLTDEASHSMTTANMAQYQRVQSDDCSAPPRWSSDSGQGTERNSASLYSHSRSPSVETEDQQFSGPTRKYTHDTTLSDDEAFDDNTEKRSFLRNTSVDRFFSRNVARFAAGRTPKVLNFFYVVFERTLLVQGFVAFTTGTVVYGGIGVSELTHLASDGALTKGAAWRRRLQCPGPLHQGWNILRIWIVDPWSMDGSVCRSWLGMEYEAIQGGGRASESGHTFCRVHRIVCHLPLRMHQRLLGASSSLG